MLTRAAVIRSAPKGERLGLQMDDETIRRERIRRVVIIIAFAIPIAFAVSFFFWR